MTGVREPQADAIGNNHNGKQHMAVTAVIFDLDGVIVTTDEYHFLGWKMLADEEGIHFDREINERCRGVSRMGSLEVVLERSAKSYSPEQKTEMATRKNNYYRKMLERLTPDDILPGVRDCLDELRRLGIKVAVGSSSRNTPVILERIGMAGWFDAVADGNDITRSKPDPEVFLIAARRLETPPGECLVVEDAAAGVEAAIAGGMWCLAVGAAKGHPAAHLHAESMADIAVGQMLAVGSQ
jgi:beta-phosphoglucomutase